MEKEEKVLKNKLRKITRSVKDYKVKSTGAASPLLIS